MCEYSESSTDFSVRVDNVSLKTECYWDYFFFLSFCVIKKGIYAGLG